MYQFIAMTDMLCALVATIALMILALKFVSKRLKMKKLDHFFMKIHKGATYVLIVTGIIHGILSFRALAVASWLVYLCGILGLLCIIGAVVTYYKKKDLKQKWVLWHGLLCLGALITLILHVYIFISGMINR